MTRDTSEAPRLAIVVHNGITGDSRVVKTAIAASRAGWDVLLLGWARSKIRTQTTMGPISVVRAPGATGAMEPIVAVTAVVTAAEVMAEGAVVVAAEEGIESQQSTVKSRESGVISR